MRDIDGHLLKAALLIVFVGSVLCSNSSAQTYGTLSPSTLSCTRSSIALGNAVLPACIENKAEVFDSLGYYVSAYCVACNGTETLIEMPAIKLNIGQQNGPCPSVVTWNFTGGVFGSGSSAYIGGTLTAQSATSWARIAASADCNGGTTQTGPNNSRLGC